MLQCISKRLLSFGSHSFLRYSHCNPTAHYPYKLLYTEIFSLNIPWLKSWTVIRIKYLFGLCQRQIFMNSELVQRVRTARSTHLHSRYSLPTAKAGYTGPHWKHATGWHRQKNAFCLAFTIRNISFTVCVDNMLISINQWTNKHSVHQEHVSSPLSICMEKDLEPIQWIRAFQGKDVATC